MMHGPKRDKLQTELCEPRRTQPPSLLTPITHGSSSSSPSSLSTLSSSLTRSVFHSELKTWLFGKSFPPQNFSSPTGLIPRTLGPFGVYSAQRLDLFACCISRSRLLALKINALSFYFIPSKSTECVVLLYGLLYSE